jgi:VanZ family protein
LNRARASGIAIGWLMVAAIVWLSLGPAAPTPDFEGGDKLGHLLAYGVLMFWFSALYRRTRERVAYAVGFIALGLALEALQGLLGHRQFDVLDLVANTLGVLLGWALALVTPRVFPAGGQGTR